MTEEKVILVDRDDNETGVMEKMEAHRKGLLHRAFSIFIFNSRGQLILQQRAKQKYHSGKLWTNTCCSHQRPGESTLEAAERRLREEMGFSTPLEIAFTHLYRAELDNSLTEHELDHVLIGNYDGPIIFNHDEVMATCLLSPKTIQEQLVTSPEKFTAWFRIIFPKLKAWMENEVEVLNYKKI